MSTMKVRGEAKYDFPVDLLSISMRRLFDAYAITITAAKGSFVKVSVSMM